MGRYSEVFYIYPDPFDDGTGSKKVALRICLFREVKNANHLLAELRNGKITGSLIKAELVHSTFQLLAAANRALHASKHEKMITKNVHTELIYSLSPTTSISDSLLTFGINENTTDIIAALVGDSSGDCLTKLLKVIKGKSVPLKELKNVTNVSKIKEVYHLKEPELNFSSIDDSIVSRMIAKDYGA
ncbi:TP53RK-binding protein [Trichinella papuae]|uniref:TP53RK-binding protein n=1 Tax=Trichinella papuae TaxID=268474 RepID=A0A0V1MF57_9BILA|nr:TP53RK-binding protein [Trichinella papuae]KRZ70378.1 TP53RK-binding protein [Trichinella papuae]